MSQHLVGIVGAAISGSEAAQIAAERGATVVVIEQNPRPYGKIEDGLPKWHVALREKETKQIDENLSHKGIYFVPNTKLGRDITWDKWLGLGFDTLILANGAWKDRPQDPALHAFEGRGLVYQNPLVYWFNHKDEANYEGPRFEIPNEVLVIGGGLASVDCAKIVNFSLYQQALSKRGIQVDFETIEGQGLPKILTDHGLSREELGIKGATLVYRRRALDMPLVSAPADNPSRLERIQQTRLKMLQKLMDKYFISFQELRSVLEPIADEDGRLKGLSFSVNAHLDGKLVPTGETESLYADMVISSIGSIPEDLDGIPQKSELYHWRDWEQGLLHGEQEVFGLGNVLTGKGNIVQSRKNAKLIMGQMGGKPWSEDAKGEAPLAEKDSHEEDQARILSWVHARWEEVGYKGNYQDWMKEQS